MYMKLPNKADYTLITKYAKTIAKSEKQKVYSGVFHVTFFTFCASFFAFHSISRQGQHSRRKSKDFVVYFFPALIKHKLRMKYKKCIVNVSYFVVFFENIREIPAKCEIWKCIAGLKRFIQLYHYYFFFFNQNEILKNMKQTFFTDCKEMQELQSILSI